MVFTCGESGGGLIEASSSCLVSEATGRFVNTMVYCMIRNFPSRVDRRSPASSGYDVPEQTQLIIFTHFVLTLNFDPKRNAPMSLRYMLPGMENSGTVPVNWLWVKAGLLSF